jgi:hypothetical protein
MDSITKNTFLTLPQNLIHHTYSFLSFEEVNRISEVCRKWQEHIEEYLVKTYADDNSLKISEVFQKRREGFSFNLKPRLCTILMF